MTMNKTASNASCRDIQEFALDGFMNLLDYMVETGSTSPGDLGEWEAMSIMIDGWIRRAGTNGLPDIAMLDDLVTVALDMLDKAQAMEDLPELLSNAPDWFDEGEASAPPSETIH